MRHPGVMKRYYYETHPAKDFGYTDEKRLQRHFGDRFLKLRWHPDTQKVFVWYDSPKDLYSLCDIPRPYDSNKAIKNLERRQQSARQLQDACRAQLEAQAKADKEQVKAIAEPIQGAFESRHKGRVTVTV